MNVSRSSSLFVLITIFILLNGTLDTTMTPNTVKYPECTAPTLFLLLLTICEVIHTSSALDTKPNHIRSLSVSVTEGSAFEAVLNIASENSSSSSEEILLGDRYLPKWESLDARPIPEWYDEAKVGIFIHWGVFSVPSYREWFWERWQTNDPACVAFMKDNYSPGFTYQDFGPQFTAEFFDPYFWADTFAKSGARYIVLTSKHHEGFTLWPSKYSFSWNAMDIGPKRDLVGDLAQAIREKTNVTFGLYHSLYEWYNPLWLSDKASGFKKNEFVTDKVIPELKEIVSTYKPEVIWSDGNWEATSDYWQAKEFLAWLYNDSPVKDTVVTNDRWGSETMCKHGGFFTCTDHFNPGVLQPKKWENCLTLDKQSWAFRRVATLKDYLTIEDVLKELVQTVAFGGNYLINIGPTKEGTLPTIMEERLLQMGKWLHVNGEAIYSSIPWNPTQVDSVTNTTYYTSNKDADKIFAILLVWPGKEVNLGSVNIDIVDKIEVLGGKMGDIRWAKRDEGGIRVRLPRQETIISRWAWTLAIQLKK